MILLSAVRRSGEAVKARNSPAGNHGYIRSNEHEDVIIEDREEEEDVVPFEVLMDEAEMGTAQG